MKGKWYLLVALVICLAGCKDDDVAPVQMLLNGDAEAGTTFPDRWWFSTGQTMNVYAVSWTKEEALSGAKSLKLSIPVADNTNFSFWAQTVSANLPIGKEVTLKVKIKGELTGEGISIAIRGDDSLVPEASAEQFVSSDGTTSITGNFDWKEYSIKLSGVNATMKSLTVYLIYNSGTSGAAYFDDISLSY